MMSKIDVICDHSQKKLRVVPMRVLDMTNLQMLYLEGNQIERLPEDIFQRLVKLNWLDLRNNKLKDIPKGIAYHAYLENLLLENNQIEVLPNELGSVPNLEMLHFSNNPLKYPPKEVLLLSTQKILDFLKTHFDIDCSLKRAKRFRSNYLVRVPSKFDNKKVGVLNLLEISAIRANNLAIITSKLYDKYERMYRLVPNLQVLQLANNPLQYPTKEVLQQGVNAICAYLKAEDDKINAPWEETSEESINKSESSEASEVEPRPRLKKISVQDLLRKSSTSATLKMESMPVITIMALSEERNKTNKHNEARTSESSKLLKMSESSKLVCPQNAKKMHKITRHCSKLNIHSHYNSNKYVGLRALRPNEDRVIDQELKNMWLSKLKELLSDQERILQQERNLKALNAWRLEKKMELPREIAPDARSEVPYDTDPEYEKMLSRKDISKELDKIIKRRKNIPKNVDMQKLINDVVSQLKILDVSEQADRSPRTELKHAEKEIQRIIELHKRVTALQAKNNVMP